ncbi:MAG TPA: hypothetical protein VLD37_06325 [Candidatus Bilamarchaeum sp.]|nr:hypothetical protein [Candidatus Bilamarchaeum sp.]
MTEEKSKKLKVGGGMAVGVVSVAALIFAIRSCKPEPERITPPPVVQTTQCPSAPVRGDHNCEIDKGEHDPLSPNFSPEDCGYCGDGNILRDPRDTNPATNALEIPSTDPRAGQPTPAGAPRRIVCDFDYACGNGTVDRNVEFSVLARPSVDGGPYSFSVARYTESCNQTPPAGQTYCAADCGQQTPQPARTGHSGGARPERTATPVVSAQPPVSGGACDASLSTSVFSSRARDMLTGNSGSVRSAVGAAPTQAVSVRVSIRVGPDGHATVTGASASCAGCEHNGASVAGMINLSGLSTTGPGAACNTGFSVNVPPG